MAQNNPLSSAAGCKDRNRDHRLRARRQTPYRSCSPPLSSRWRGLRGCQLGRFGQTRRHRSAIGSAETVWQSASGNHLERVLSCHRAVRPHQAALPERSGVSDQGRRFGQRRRDRPSSRSAGAAAGISSNRLGSLRPWLPLWDLAAAAACCRGAQGCRCRNSRPHLAPAEPACTAVGPGASAVRALRSSFAPDGRRPVQQPARPQPELQFSSCPFSPPKEDFIKRHSDPQSRQSHGQTKECFQQRTDFYAEKAKGAAELPPECRNVQPASGQLAVAMLELFARSARADVIARRIAPCGRIGLIKAIQPRARHCGRAGRWPLGFGVAATGACRPAPAAGPASAPSSALALPWSAGGSGLVARSPARARSSAWSRTAETPSVLYSFSGSRCA